MLFFSGGGGAVASEQYVMYVPYIDSTRRGTEETPLPRKDWPKRGKEGLIL